jgi:hypothetical protein
MTVIRSAIIDDITYIVDLANKESNCLGFIPKMAYESAITGKKTGKRWSDVCNDKIWVCTENEQPVGFVLASFGRINTVNKQGKIAQIALQTDARKLLRGRSLLNAVIEHGEKNFTIGFSAGCADDLESNIFWQAMGWVKVGERYGISHTNTWKQTSKRKINIYRYDPTDFLIKI